MILSHPATKKRVAGVTNPATLAKLEAAGWSASREAQAPRVAPSEPEIPAGNASRDAWAEYARHLGITVEDDAKRDEIRANVEALLGDDED